MLSTLCLDTFACVKVSCALNLGVKMTFGVKHKPLFKFRSDSPYEIACEVMTAPTYKHLFR